MIGISKPRLRTHSKNLQTVQGMFSANHHHIFIATDYQILSTNTMNRVWSGHHRCFNREQW